MNYKTLKEWYEFNKEIFGYSKRYTVSVCVVFNKKENKPMDYMYEVNGCFSTSTPFIIELLGDYLVYSVGLKNSAIDIAVISPKVFKEDNRNEKTPDMIAKEILANIADMPVESSLDSITKKIIFGNTISQEKTDGKRN